MKFKWLIPLSLLCVLASAQTKTPLVQPHWTFVDNSGAACAGCSLYSYLAGTTTPTPTYTDASGATQNTNPVILDTSGSANIWVGTTTLKLVLKDAVGNLLWTIDNIPAGGGGGGTTVCGPASTIQISNGTLTGLTCDSLITINTLTHTINVGGALPANHFSLQNLSAITASWTLDVTSPTTAALSVGGGTKAAGKYIDGGTGQWTTLPAPAGGTVTSVAASTTGNPLSVSGSPITSSGTLAFTLGVTGTGSKTVTASAAGTSGNYACWNGSGDLAGSSTPCVATNDEYFTVTGCFLSASTDNQCSGSFNLPVAMPDSSYTIFTQANVNGGSQNVFMTINQSTLPATPSTAINYVLTCTYDCTSGVSPTVYIHAHHN